MTKILGGIVSWILSPVTKLIIYGLYNFLIRGPLWILNMENRVLSYASGSYTDKLLFDTSIVNGKPHLNFFSSTSPLKPFYMTMVTAGVVVLTIFIGFAIVQSFYKDKNQPGVLKKMGQMTLSASLVVIVPTAFLGGVSLSGALMSTIKGDNINIDSSSVNKYKKTTSSLLATLRGGSYNTKSFNKTSVSDFGGQLYDNNLKSPWQDSSKKNQTLTLNQIYDDLIKPIGNTSRNFQVSEDINVMAKQSKELYKVINDQLVSYDTSSTGKSMLNNDLNDKLNEVEGILINLRPNYKNQAEADKLKEFIYYANSLTKSINAWSDSVHKILSYLPIELKTPQDAAISNLKVAFESIYGSGDVATNSIETIGDFQTVLGKFISGNANGYEGLLTLNQYIANIKDNDLVVIFYQIVTGNKDSNWNQTFTTFPHNTGAMLLIGVILILAAVLMLAGIILESFVRIIILGLLFVFGGFLIPWSAVDNGARLKTWINMVIGQLICLFGVILILRFGFILLDKFKAILDMTPEFKDSESGFLTRSLLLAFFAYAIMVGAQRSRAMLLQLAGSNQGLMTPKSLGGMAKTLWRGSKVVGAATGAALGLSALKKISGGGQSNGSSGSGTSRLANFKNTWVKRAKAPINKAKAINQGIANVSRGKMGTKRARVNALVNLARNRDQKLEKLKINTNLNQGWNKVKKSSFEDVKNEYNTHKEKFQSTKKHLRNKSKEKKDV